MPGEITGFCEALIGRGDKRCGRRLGPDGKCSVHPDQIVPTTQVEQQVRRAARLHTTLTRLALETRK